MGFNWSFFARNHAHEGEDVDGSKRIRSSAVIGAPPSGSIIMYGGAAAPAEWLLCDGSAVSRTLYAALFAAIGTTFGAGDASTTFNLPDMRGVFPKGAGTTNRAAGKDANGNYYAATLGSYLTDKMQGHKHSLNTNGAAGTSYTIARNDSQATATPVATGITTPITDGTNGTPRTGLTTEPQSLGLTYIIKT